MSERNEPYGGGAQPYKSGRKSQACPGQNTIYRARAISGADIARYQDHGATQHRMNSCEGLIAPIHRWAAPGGILP